MDKLQSDIQKINDLQAQLNAAKDKVSDPLDRLAPGAFEIQSRYGITSIKSTTEPKCYDLRFKNWFDVEEEIRPFIQVIADQMGEQDFPVPKSDVTSFIPYFGCNKAESKLLYSKAASDKAYRQWQEDELNGFHCD